MFVLLKRTRNEASTFVLILPDLPIERTDARWRAGSLGTVSVRGAAAQAANGNQSRVDVPLRGQHHLEALGADRRPLRQGRRGQRLGRVRGCRRHFDEAVRVDVGVVREVREQAPGQGRVQRGPNNCAPVVRRVQEEGLDRLRRRPALLQNFNIG